MLFWIVWSGLTKLAYREASGMEEENVKMHMKNDLFNPKIIIKKSQKAN